MKSVLISLTLFLPIFLLGQDSYNNNQTTCGDKKGITPMFQLNEKQSSEDFLSGKEPIVIQSFCVYKKHKNTNKKVTGTVYEKYPNGNLKYEMFYKNGRVKGWGNYYNPDGSLLCKIKYKRSQWWIFGSVTKFEYY